MQFLPVLILPELLPPEPQMLCKVNLKKVTYSLHSSSRRKLVVRVYGVFVRVCVRTRRGEGSEPEGDTLGRAALYPCS